MWPAFYAVCLLPILARTPGSEARLQPARTSRSLGAVFETPQTAPPHAVVVPFWFYPRATFVCPHSGFFPDHNNCRLFYKCVTVLYGHLVRHIYKCDDHHLYSIEMEACVPSEQVNRIECQKEIVTNPPPPPPPPPEPLQPPGVVTNPSPPSSQPHVVVTNPPQPPAKPYIQPDIHHRTEFTPLPRENQFSRTNLLVTVPQNGTRTTPQHYTETKPLPRDNQSNRTNLLVTVPQNGTRTTPQHPTANTSLPRENHFSWTNLLVTVPQNSTRTTPQQPTENTSLPRKNEFNQTNLLVTVPQNGTRTTLQRYTEIKLLPRDNQSNLTNLLVSVPQNGTRTIPEVGMDLPSFYKMHKEIGGRLSLYSTKPEQSTSSVWKEPTGLTIGILTKLTSAGGTSSATQSTEHVFEENSQNITSKTLTTGKLFKQITKINPSNTMDPPKKSFEHNAKRPYPPTTDLPLSDEILFEDSTEDISIVPSATATQISISTKTLFDQDSNDGNNDDDFNLDVDEDNDCDTRESVPTEESTNTSGYPSTQESFEQDTDDNVTEETSEKNSVEDCVESGFFPDPYNCSKFYRCVDFGSEFVKYQFSCPSETIWDDSLKSCNFPMQVKRTNACVYFPPTTTTELPFTIIEPDESLVNLNVSRLTITCPTGFRTHPKYCNMFYQCTMDKRLKINFMIFACPEGTVFHEKEAQCSEDEKVTTNPEGCAIFQQEEKPDSIQILNVPNGKLCPNTGQFPDGRTCSSKYFRCNRDNEGNLQGFLLDCPRGHVYSHAANRCVSLFLYPFCMRRYLSTKH